MICDESGSLRCSDQTEGFEAEEHLSWTPAAWTNQRERQEIIWKKTAAGRQVNSTGVSLCCWTDVASWCKQLMPQRSRCVRRVNGKKLRGEEKQEETFLKELKLHLFLMLINKLQTWVKCLKSKADYHADLKLDPVKKVCFYSDIAESLNVDSFLSASSYFIQTYEGI